LNSAKNSFSILILTKKKLENFANLGQKFLNDQLSPQDYYKQIFAVLGGRNKNSVDIFLEILTLIPPSKKIKQEQLFEVHNKKSENWTRFGGEESFGENDKVERIRELGNTKVAPGDHETLFPSLPTQQHFTTFSLGIGSGDWNARTSGCENGTLQPEAFPTLPVSEPLPQGVVALQRKEEEESKVEKNYKNKKRKKVLVSWG